MPGSEAPYLSLVATARNDDHGGNLLRRMQVFVDAWINQAKRHNLHCELILVEWNPPQDRERLATALRWPRDTGPCQVRIIEVPHEIHARYQYASVLPLYQMIAKNVGIRRARGEFILATNIDIVFSDELMEFLASRRLEQGRMYRIDRTDVMSDVPVDGTLDEQLAYCRSHVIRLCVREGIYPATADRHRKNEEADITSPESGVHFGAGLFSVERWDNQQPFRWMGNDAEIFLAERPRGGILTLDVEVGSGIDSLPARLQVLDCRRSLVGEWIVNGRSKLELVVPPDHAGKSFWLRAPGGGRPTVNDPRILNFRIFRCDWLETLQHAPSHISTRTVMRAERPLLGRLLGAGRPHGIQRFRLQGLATWRRAIGLLGRRAEDIFESGLEFRMGQGWHSLEQAERERFRWVSRDAQLAVRTIEGRSLALLIEPGPTIGHQPFELVVRDAGGGVIARERVSGLTYVDVGLPVPAGEMATLVLSAEGGGARIGNDPRDLHFRVYACGHGMRAAKVLAEPTGPPRFWITCTGASTAPEVDWTSTLEEWRLQIVDMGKPVFLHLSACGDFTLMAREHWQDLRGYAELDLFSMHLDSLLCCAAHEAGAREELLVEPLRIYHIEHGIGSGWTPEGKGQLYERLAHKRIQSVSYDEVVWAIAQMRSLHAPLIFNLEDWGLEGIQFSETCLSPHSTASGTGH